MFGILDRHDSRVIFDADLVHRIAGEISMKRQDRGLG